jgi:uncharacterized membrane protein YhaH (DUF805 family)
MNWIHLFTGFDGRISRKPFWIAWAVLAAAEIAVALATQGIDGDRIAAVADLVLIYPEFAVCTKRGHDRNTPTWVIGLFFALAAVFDLLLLAGWTTSASLEKQTTLALLLVVPIGLFALVLIIDLGFRRGTPGPNRYGPDPLEAQA